MFFLTLRKSALVLTLLFLLLSFSIVLSAQDKDWRPVTPGELSLTKPSVEPDADAESLFWDVRVDDSSSDGLALVHYVRVKIFTQRGRDRFSSYDIQFGKNTKIKDVQAKVTKADGSVVMLKKEDVHERDVVVGDGLKIKAKSFAIPSLDVGSILEYRYREIRDGGSANMALLFQRDIPIQTISFHVKPFNGDIGMSYLPFNMGETKFQKEKDGFYGATMTNVAAFHEEPSMLPPDEVRSWMYIYYRAVQPKDTTEYWRNISKIVYDGAKDRFKAGDDVKTVTQTTIAGATTDDEKLHKIFDFVKTQFRNLTYSTNVSDDDRKKALNAKSGSDVLKIKMGSSSDIDTLFGAMARAAGFDPRVALSGDRSEMLFHPDIPNVSLMLNSSSVAIKVGEEWKFFSPAEYFTPYGMLGWVEQGQAALISDPKELIWQNIPVSAATASMEKRTGKFKLLEDGTLEGDGRIEFTGLRSASMKAINNGDSATEQEKTLRDYVKANILPAAEVESFTIENANEPDKPFTYTFKIKVPGYASRTGKRLFLQPNVFERNSKPRFVSSTRKYAIYFSFPYSEQDDLEIELPQGFSLESADAPAPIQDTKAIGTHETKISVASGGKVLLYKRSFSFGNGGNIGFPATAYPVIKSYFEAYNRADVHQVTLKQEAAVAKP